MAFSIYFKSSVCAIFLSGVIFSANSFAQHLDSISNNKSKSNISSGSDSAPGYLSNLSDQVAMQAKDIESLKSQVSALKAKVNSNDALISYLSQEVMQIQAGTKLSTVNYPRSIIVPASNKSDKSKISESVKSQNVLLKKAYDFMANNKPNSAIKSFNDYLKQYPKSPDADDINYLLGELYIQEKKTDLAIQSFKKVSDNSPRESDAKLALGQLYLAAGDAYNSKKIFDEIIKKYPKTNNAQTAKLLLDNM